MIERSNLSLLPRYAASADGVTGAGVGPGQGPAADAGVEPEHDRGHRLDDGRALHVTQLTPVQLAIGLDPFGPAQVDVAGRLHQPLPLDHPLAGLLEPALGQVVLEHRGRRLLDLEEQRVLLVTALEQAR